MYTLTYTSVHIAHSLCAVQAKNPSYKTIGKTVKKKFGGPPENPTKLKKGDIIVVVNDNKLFIDFR